MIEKDLLEQLYISYGFELEISREKNISIFVYKKSRYFGVDIIPITDDEVTLRKAEEIKNEYSNLGYAVNYKKIKNNSEAEVELFKVSS
ncbi:hypothetical protein [Arcticibacter sp. MXS-1]|uniref:hypothetical protein n=1 Tax=Arcticibacter sp. MXS-1 TaxID=3341726 RepID=UPI0035A8A728